MEGLNSGAVSAPFAAAMDAEVIIVIGANPTVNHPVAATFIKNAAKRGAKLIVMDPRRQIAVAPRLQASAVQGRQRCRDAERDDQHHHHRRTDRPAIYRRLYRRL